MSTQAILYGILVEIIISNIIVDIKKSYEKIDCLINCAGMWILGDMSKTEEPLYKEMN